MSEAIEDLKLYKEFSKKRKLNNKRQSTKILIANGISFTSHNNGIHLIISHNDKTIDFYPSTGKWIVRTVKVGGRGIFKLLEYLNGKDS